MSDNRARVTYAAATPAVKKVFVAHQDHSKIAENYLLGSRACLMRVRRLLARLYVFMPTNQLHGYNDISEFVDGNTLKNARASRPFCRCRHPSKWVVAIKMALS
jgi:hypothetical protein